jgi:hypothetical protein
VDYIISIIKNNTKAIICLPIIDKSEKESIVNGESFLLCEDESSSKKEENSLNNELLTENIPIAIQIVNPFMVVC